MSSSEDYQAKIAEIETISDDQVKSPIMPINYAQFYNHKISERSFAMYKQLMSLILLMFISLYSQAQDNRIIGNKLYHSPDSSLNLQASIDMLKNGDTLLIAKGEYLSEKQLIIENKNNITLVFNQESNILCNNIYETVFRIQNSSNITIKNGTFKHINFNNDFYCTGDVFYIDKASSITLEDCDINGCGSVGISAYESNDITLTKCKIHDNSEGAFNFSSECKNININYCNMFSNGRTKNNILFVDWGKQAKVNIIEYELPNKCVNTLDTISTAEVIRYDLKDDFDASYSGPEVLELIKPMDIEIPDFFTNYPFQSFYFLNYVNDQTIPSLNIKNILCGCLDNNDPILTNFFTFPGLESFNEKYKNWDEFEAKILQKEVIDSLTVSYTRFVNSFNRLFDPQQLMTIRLKIPEETVWIDIVPYNKGVTYIKIDKSCYDFDNEIIRIPTLFREKPEERISNYLDMYVNRFRRSFPMIIEKHIPIKDAKIIFGGPENTYVETIVDIIPYSTFFKHDYYRYACSAFDIVRIKKNFYRENQWDADTKCFVLPPVYQIVMESTDKQPLGNITNYQMIYIPSMEKYIDIDSLKVNIRPSFSNYIGFYKSDNLSIRLSLDANKKSNCTLFETHDNGKKSEIKLFNPKIVQGNLKYTGSTSAEITPDIVAIIFVKYGNIQGIMVKINDNSPLGRQIFFEKLKEK